MSDIISALTQQAQDIVSGSSTTSLPPLSDINSSVLCIQGTVEEFLKEMVDVLNNIHIQLPLQTISAPTTFFQSSSSSNNSIPSVDSIQAMLGNLSIDFTSLVNSLPASAHTTATGEGVLIGGYPVQTIMLIFGALTSLATVTTALQKPSISKTNTTLPTRYNIDQLTAYYNERPVIVAARSLQILREMSAYGIGLLADMALGKLASNAPKRAYQLRVAIERLGPAFVKVAQAFSTRVDLLDPSYLLQIEELQDNVAPFDDDQARDVIADAFGMPIADAFVSLTPSPVAAASLGQVYKGRLMTKDGQGKDSCIEVAVKVRRPDVLESVSLDLFIMRNIALQLNKIPEMNSDWAGIIDEWATAFFQEMDYQQEAANAARFANDVERYNLTGIVVPEVVFASDNGVLVTQWIDGEKLSESTASDIRELCNTLLSCYLIQLLDSCFMHADPHPGNLLRTPDGKIAILDYGLMTEVDPQYAVALLEYIAHLQTQDWDAVTDDLVNLGFVPKWAPNPREAGLAEPLGAILSQLVQGGGAANINIAAITEELEQLTELYPYFTVEKSFVLILRTFSVIEGIALRVDPSYSIVKECLPYLARRLLIDDSPRMRAALRQVLFAGGERVDFSRIELIAGGLSRFTVDGQQQDASSVVDDINTNSGPILNDAMKDTIKTVLSPQGSYVQEIIAEEAAATIDAAGRVFLGAFIGRALQSVPAMMSKNAIEALGPLRPILLPGPTPTEVLRQLMPVMELTESERESLSGVESLTRTMVGSTTASILGSVDMNDSSSVESRVRVDQTIKLANEMLPLLPDVGLGVLKTAELTGQALMRRAVDRLRNGYTSATNDMDV